MKLKRFEEFVSINEEVDVLELKSLSKKIYQDLKSSGKTVELKTTDNKSEIGDTYDKTGKASDITISYYLLKDGPILNVLGFDTKEEAQEILDKYKSDLVLGKTGVYSGEKTTYTIQFKLKGY